MTVCMNHYTIEIADNRAKYQGLRDLWCRVFGDDPEFVDAFYAAFGYRPDSDSSAAGVSRSGDDASAESIRGYVVCSEAGKVVSALTCHRCGEMAVHSDADGREISLPVYVSYAICTDPEYRGLGLGQMLTAHVRDIVTDELGGISLVSPAEESLIVYYEKLGYREGFFTDERLVVAESEDSSEVGAEETAADASSHGNAIIWGRSDDGGLKRLETEENREAYDPALTADVIDAVTYNRYREEFLGDTAHVSLSPEMMECVRMCSAGGDGLLLINRGDAICALSSQEPVLKADELLINPALSALSEEIGEEIASRFALHMGRGMIIYRSPGLAASQAMYAAPQGIDICGYYGFPIE